MGGGGYFPLEMLTTPVSAQFFLGKGKNFTRSPPPVLPGLIKKNAFLNAFIFNYAISINLSRDMLGRQGLKVRFDRASIFMLIFCYKFRFFCV